MIARCLHTIGRLCLTRPWHIVLLFGLLVLGSLPLVVQLPLEADLRATLPREVVQTLERYHRLFGKGDLAFLVVQTETRSRTDLIAYAQTLSQRLTASPLIRRVEFGHSPALLAMLDEIALTYAPLFVGPEQLQVFDRLLTPGGIRSQIHKTLLDLSAIGSPLRDRALQGDPLQLRRFAFARLATLRGSFRFDPVSPYFLSEAGTALLIKVAGAVPVDDMAGAKAIVSLLQRTSQDVLAQPVFQGLTVQGTGGYFLAAESERVIRRDLVRSLNLAILCIAFLMVWAFRRWGVLGYGQIPTLVGLCMALGVFALIRPKLNALTLGCAAALVGLGIDFTVHILTQCFVELGKGRSVQTAIQTSVYETGGSLFLAAATTMAAFAAFLFSTQRFLQDMGLLAILGIFFCLLLSVILLPALVVCLPGRKRHPKPRTLGISQLIAFTLRAPRLIIGLSGVFCLGAVVAIAWRPPTFETDLRNIHAAESPALQVQAKMTTLFGGSQEPLTLLLEGETEAQVMQAMHRLQPGLQAMIDDGILAAVTSLSTLFPAPEIQEAVLQRLRQKDADALLTILNARLEEAGFDIATRQGYITQVRQVLNLRDSLDLTALKSRGFEEFIQPFLGHDDAGAAGVVVLFPKHELWTLADRSRLSQQLSEILTSLGLQGRLIGLYTVSSESAAQIGADFRRITLLALVFIGAVICLRFRRPRLIGLVFLPVTCGTLWTAGLFALFDLKLNFMNIAILPMLLGVGIDDGIHIVQRFRTQGAQDVCAALQFTGTAVCLTSLTTILAFGTLALSANQGIASVGLVSLIGITSCLVASLLTLPAALQLWEEKPHRGNRHVNIA